MKVVQDDLWLCVDCTVAACNGDFSGIDSDERVAEVEAGLEKLGPHLVPDDDSETGEGHEDFSHRGCDCCGSRLAGEMHRFAILGEGEPEPKPLRCDMVDACTAPVTYIDDKGFVYCTTHGNARKASHRRCRKLKPAELKQLQAGKPLGHY